VLAHIAALVAALSISLRLWITYQAKSVTGSSSVLGMTSRSSFLLCMVSPAMSLEQRHVMMSSQSTMIGS